MPWAFFLDEETREHLLDVPILEPLPTEWRIADYSNQDVLNLYVSDVTREGYDCDMDPPMTSEALGKLGVEFVIFTLGQAYIGGLRHSI